VTDTANPTAANVHAGRPVTRGGLTNLATTLTVAVALLMATVAAPGTAMAVPACTAADVTAADPGCPGDASPCQITQVFEVGDGCTLDFGGRAVTLTKTGGIEMPELVVEITAGSFTVAGGATIDGQGSQGGELTVTTTGDIAVEQSIGGSGILMGGLNFGGLVTLSAGGNIIIDGAVRTSRLGPNAAGGSISLAAGGDIVTGSQSSIDPRGAPQVGGGDLFLNAAGRIELGNLVDVGGETGVLMADAGSGLTVNANLLANGSGSGGDAGEIALRADGDVEINGQVQCKGSSGGGFGGEVNVYSMRGDVIVRSEISAKSGAPDGDAGLIDIATDEREGGSIDIRAPGGVLDAEGNGIESSGGTITIDAGLDVTVGGRILAAGGETGGDIEVTAGRHVTVKEKIDAVGRSADSLAGTVTIDAGASTSGNVDIQSEIDVSAGGCSVLCSTAGDVDISACDLRVGVSGSIDATAPGNGGKGGSTELVARRQLRIDGPVDARATNAGVNVIRHPASKPPIISPGRVLPLPQVSACADCAEDSCKKAFCERLCDCGDGHVDPFEKCDGAGTCMGEEVCGAPGTAAECVCILTCGNGMLDPGEQCDGTNFGGGTCELLGFPGGDLTCRGDCTIDTSACDPITCGDGTIGEGEVCEPDDLDGRTCELLGFGGGTLGCDPGCAAFDDSGCAVGACGDGVRCFNAACTTGPGGGPETCDDGNMNDADGCRNDCSLAACGDGAVCTQPDCSSGSNNGPEQCDDGNASNADACLSDCTEAACGDRLVCSAAGCTSGPAGGPEECDGGACCLSDCAVRPCNGTGACIPGFLCCPAGANCGDGNPCTTDGCNPGTGCTHAANQDACDDGDPCTVNDACGGGSCQPGAPLDCSDGNPCTVDRCDPSSGCVSALDFDACPVATVAGRKITLKTKASNAKKNTLTLSLKGQFAPPNPAEVPTIAGASLRVRDAAGQDVTFDLPAGSWKAKGSKFSYKDAKGRNGACTKAVFKAGKSIQAICKGERIRLGPSLLEPVQVILRTGNTFYCGAFGGKVSKNGDGTFIAKGAEAPGECAVALQLPLQ
jgi:hypothetical protein